MLARQKQPSLQGSERVQLFYALLFLFVLFSPFYSFAQSAHQGTDFTARLMNLEAAANETFRYNATLRNGTSHGSVYSLTADAPIGWNVAFKVEGSQVASLRLDSNKTQDISIEINPTPVAKPGKYTIPLKAVSGSDTATLNLEAVVKGSYSVELTTPTGRLSDEVTEGSNTVIHLVVHNTGTIALDNLELAAQAPSQWDASFAPSKINRLEPGQSQDVTTTVKVPDKTIAGDYVTTFNVKSSNANANAAFRITVKTSLLSGWLGILIILIAIGAIYYLIRKYGRR
ncbi:MAG TPA: NEW3 domain-containing protein [Niabella sp.]